MAAVSSALRQKLKQALTSYRVVKDIFLATTEPEEKTCLVAVVKVDGQPASILLDTGAAVCAIDYEFIKELEFTIQKPATFNIKGIGRSKITPLGMIPDFPISIDEVVIPVNVAVLQDLKYDIILETDFFSRAGAQISFDKENPRMILNYQGRTRILQADCSKHRSFYSGLEEGLEEEEVENMNMMFLEEPRSIRSQWQKISQKKEKIE